MDIVIGILLVNKQTLFVDLKLIKICLQYTYNLWIYMSGRWNMLYNLFSYLNIY